MVTLTGKVNVENLRKVATQIARELQLKGDLNNGLRCGK